MKKLIIFLLMMLPLGVFAQESKIAIVNTQEVIQLCRNLQRCRNKMADMEAKYKNENAGGCRMNTIRSIPILLHSRIH